jgi:poly [ADP-ribose] polymerase
VFSNIGSPKLRALLSAAPAPATTNEAAALHDFTSRRVLPETNLTQAVKDLVEYMYEEASKALNKSLGPAKITARGIETPLGVVGLAQIERGEAILQKLYEIFKLGDSSSANKTAVEDLTNEFYTIIPHNLGGRGRDQVAQAVINKISMFHEKSELLQLMKDMLQLANEGRGMNVSDIDMKYLALKSKIVHLEPNSEKFQEISSFVRNSQVGSDNVNIANIYTVHRDKVRFQKVTF